MLKLFASLRSRAIILVLLAILPVLALTLDEYFDQRNRAIAEVQRDELVAARNLATIQETLINNTRQLLENLAQSAAVQRRDRAVCDLMFAKVLAQSPYYSAIVSVDSEGWLCASAPAAPGPVNYADRLWFRETLRTRAFFVGEPLVGRINKKNSLNLAYPILDEAGRLQGALTVGLDLQWLGNLLVKNDLPPGAALALTDATWKVLYRYPEPLEYIGKPLPAGLIQAMAGRDEGVAQGEGLPGDMRLFAFARLSPPWQELRVAIGLPRERALARVNQDLQRNLIWLAAVAALALAAAGIGGKIFILQPVEKLLEVTRRLTGGDLTARTGASSKAGELSQLAQAFDKMADSLQERDAEIKQTATELEQRVLELGVANKELENFTYSVAHDLRAPLRAIGGFARVLLDEYPGKLDETGERCLNIINQEAFKMGRLIDDLLALARLGRKEMKYRPIVMTELAQTISEELQAAHPERNLQIEIQPLPQAFADYSMLRQVLTNLLLNALKFSRTRETARIQISGWSEEDEHVYSVKDNGVGFDMRYVNKLFGVFQRLHSEKDFEGTGTGLAFVKRIIERHGGRIWGESVVNEGAVFYFTLPKKVGS